MSAVLAVDGDAPGGVLARTWRTWRATPRRSWALLLLIGALASLMGLPWLFEQASQPGFRAPMAAVMLGLPMLCACIVGAFYVAAVAGTTGRERTRRVVAALVAGTTVAVLASTPLWIYSGFLAFQQAAAAAKGVSMAPLPLILLADALHALTIGGLAVAVVETLNRRGVLSEELARVQQDQANMQRAVLQSRLTAMQAQVEPRFLFDTLVDIERLYRRDAQSAADVLDRLIDYLRAALPRLRESGSSIGAEVELVQAYLSVVTALHDGRPAFAAAVDPACRDARFYPMLLLPLVQRAARSQAGAPPATLSLRACCDGRRVAVTLDIGAAGLCVDAPELEGVRERLTGLYGDRATLACTDGAGGTTFTLTVPADSGRP